MRCDNLFCIYWTEDGCSLNEISLDISGCCECCIYVDIDEATLKRKRDELLRRD